MQQYVGAIFSFGFNFAPAGWALCDGTLLSIANNEALYSLIGTTFGGDGTTTFALPNLQGRVPIGTGQGLGLPSYVIGQSGGHEAISLTAANLPPHSHVPTTVMPATSVAATGNVPATGNLYAGASFNAYTATAANAQMAATTGASGVTGSSIPISILNPYTTINYCIATSGIYPSRN